MRILSIIILILFISCGREIETKNEIKIREFQHVVEKYDGLLDGYDYDYSDNRLDSIEVRELMRIFNKKNISYFISNEGYLFYEQNNILSIEGLFILDRELIDSIVSKKLPQSNFVENLIKDLNK